MNKCPICGAPLVQITGIQSCLYCGFKEENKKEETEKRPNKIILMKNKEIEQKAHKALLSNINGSLDYCKGRAITEETIEKWNLGYIHDDFKEMSEYWQNRLLFPIKNNEGTQTIAFGGRKLEKESDRPKYFNSSSRDFYVKGENLFGYCYIPNETEKIFLCEGYMDTLTMSSFGYNAVASLGTALTRQQAALLSKKTKSVCIAYDADAPGEEATIKAIDILWKAGFKAEDITVIKPESAKDVDEALKAGDRLINMKLSQYLIKNEKYAKLLDAFMHRREI